MKKMMWVAVLAGMCAAAGTMMAGAQEARVVNVSAPQVKDDLFAGTEKFANGASSVTELNMDPNMLAMVSHGNADLAKKMDFVVVHSYEYDKPGMYNANDVEVFRKKLTDGSWSCFLHVTDAKSGEKTDMCVRASGDTNELVLLAAEPKELTFIHIKGRMPLADLERMNSMTRMTADMARRGMGMGSSFTPYTFTVTPHVSMRQGDGVVKTAPTPPTPPAAPAQGK